MADNDDDYDYNYEKLILRPLDVVARGQKVSRHTLQTTLMNIISGSDSPPSPSGIDLPDIQLLEHM